MVIRVMQWRGQARRWRALRPLVLIALLVGAAAAGAGAQAAPLPDTLGQRLAACTACHGVAGRAGPDAYYPRIAGKPAGYLFHQLQNFRDGRRHYQPMNDLIVGIPDAYFQVMATYFESVPPIYFGPPASGLAPALLARGKSLVTEGDRAAGVPACQDCHGSRLMGVAPDVPGLLGLVPDYLTAQLGNWRNGTRHAIEPDCMAQITRRLSDADLNAVVAWLSSQAVPTDTHPDAAFAARPPMNCGSIGGH